MDSSQFNEIREKQRHIMSCLLCNIPRRQKYGFNIDLGRRLNIMLVKLFARSLFIFIK